MSLIHLFSHSYRLKQEGKKWPEVCIVFVLISAIGKKGNKKGGNGGGAPQKAAEPKEVKKEAKEGGEEQFKFNFGGAGKGQQVFDLAGKDGSLTRSSVTNPLAAILPMIQKKLDTLVGKPSGYFESLPTVVQHRIKALKGLQVNNGKTLLKAL